MEASRRPISRLTRSGLGSCSWPDGDAHKCATALEPTCDGIAQIVDTHARVRLVPSPACQGTWLRFLSDYMRWSSSVYRRAPTADRRTAALLSADPSEPN